jgi:hypothetical protein
VTSDAQAVCDAITRQRKYGHPTCAVDNRTAAADPQRYREVLDEFVATLGFTGLGEGWIEISTQAAKTLVREVLFKDLAYSVAMMSEDEAALLTERFFALFDPSVRCFTNGNLVVRDADPTEVPGSWNPITEATFDAGVVCLGSSRIGILWVEDED